MGTSGAESELTFPVMISKHDNGITGGLMTLPATNSAEGNHLKLEKRLSSSSSSSSLSSGGLEFELVSADCSRLLSGEDAALNPDNSESGIPIISMPGQEKHPSNESPIESPPKQVMERPAADATNAQYRIPSSVFKQSNQADWSVASNESLFSIYTGNMSLTREQAGWFGMSGELSLQGDHGLSQIDYTSNQPPSVQAQINKSNEMGRNNPSVGGTESKAAETMREVIRESEADASIEKFNSKTPQPSASLRHSDASAKSFAFPILTGEHKDSPKQKAPSQPNTLMAAEEFESPKKAQPEMNAPDNPSRWFSGILRCSCCS